MTLLTVLHYPDERLRTVAKPVTEFNEALKKTVQDLLETMHHLGGIGLAATQVNIHQRIIVLNVSESTESGHKSAAKNEVLVLINPSIVEQSTEKNTYEEGCLSVPGFYEKVIRPKIVQVRAQDTAGKWIEMSADALLATCIQHEIDHLNGKVFVDHLSKLKQIRIQEKIAKAEYKARRK